MNTSRTTPLAPGWLHLWEVVPEWTGTPPEELLRKTAVQPGTWRLATHDGWTVERRGELRAENGKEPEETTEDLITAALEELGLEGKRRDRGWVLPVSSRCPAEVSLLTTGEEVRVELTLTAWDEIGPVEERALAWFLTRAQAGLRFARCEMEPGRALVTARLATGDVATGLPHALGGVLAGGRALSREVQALTVPEMARAYLEFVAVATEREVDRSRI